MPESAAYAVALLAAATFGTADFLGGLASRRAGVLVATVVGQAAGFAVLLPGVLLQQALPDHSSVAWGALAGLSGSLGLLVFFSALAGGSMSLAAPAAAVVTAVVPVLAGLALGNRPSSQAWLGVAGGLLAVAAISWSGRDGRVGVRVLLLAVGAGVAFGVFFVCLSRASQAAGLWPIVAARMSSLTVLSGAVVAGRAEWRAARGALRLAVVSGAMDVIANGLFLFAVGRGVLALVGVLVSLYPAATVVLAVAVLGERLRVWQLGGIALALLSAGLIAAS